MGARGARRFLIAPLIMAATLLVTSTAAFAASSSNDADVYRTATYECTHDHVYITNNTLGGHLDSQATSEIAYGSGSTYIPCYSNESLPAGLIAIAENLYKWSGSAWYLCNAGAYYYNQSYAAHSSTGWNFLWACGSGYYFASAGAYVYNNGWNGGWLSTNYVQV